jgi:DNA-binding IclR family transcriptional regulator
MRRLATPFSTATPQACSPNEAARRKSARPHRLPAYRFLQYKRCMKKATRFNASDDFPVSPATSKTFPEDRAQIQVIARAAAILRALEDNDQGLSLGQIAGLVALPRSTVQRIVAALEAEKFVIAATPAGGVRLGPALLRLAASVKITASAIIRPFLIELSSELKETVDLSTPKRDHVVFIDQVVGSQRLRTISAIGEAFPLYCTANGKAFLATLDDDEILRRIGRRYEPRTARTHTTFEALQVDLERVRAQGFSLDVDEHTLGISAAGILVHDTLGSPMLISVPVPSARFEERKKLIVENLLVLKSKLLAQFGPSA